MRDDERRISGNMVRKVGPHPVANVSGGESSSSPSEMPRSREGGNFGQGPPLQKNESGSGYHVKGAPGFEDDDDDGPTREQEEGMTFERALWLKSGPNPRYRGKR